MNRIGIPYIFWAMLSSIIAIIPHPYQGVFNGPLWFLQTLFSSLIIMQILYKIKKSNILVILLLISLLTPYLYNYNFLPFHINRAIVAFFYIMMGCLMNNYLKNNQKSTYYFAISTLLFFSLFYILYVKLSFSGSYIDLSMYRHNTILVYLCSLLGIFMIIFFSKIIKTNRLLIFLGTNSLVIMCVHFPICQTLNTYISYTSYYQTTYMRVLMAIGEWGIALIISALLALICKKYIPKVTGYKAIIKL